MLDVYEQEQASGLIVSVGGQVPNNLALPLEAQGVNILGTPPQNIDMAEDRNKFSSILDKIGVDQPEWGEVSNVAKAKEFCRLAAAHQPTQSERFRSTGSGQGGAGQEGYGG